MSELQTEIARPADRVGRVLFSVSYGFALLGGFIMAGLAAMVVVSVAGRWLFSAPIFGDFEMVAFGTAVAVFLFLPYCHMRRGNVIVDLFLSWAPRRVQGFFDIVGSVLLCAIAGTMAWRMTLGGVDFLAYNDTTYILALPLWWAFPFTVAASGLLALCCFYTAARDAANLLR